MIRVHRVVSVLVLAVAAAALTACQGLAQALGANPAATAPAYNGIGVVAQPGAEVKVYGSPNQSGPVGASGSASAQADMAQTTEIGAEAISALLDAAQAALAGGDPAAARGILGAAQKISGAKREKLAPAATPSAKDAATAAAAAAIAKGTAPGIPAPSPGGSPPAPSAGSLASGAAPVPAGGAPPATSGDATK
jgi:hypothetical protein